MEYLTPEELQEYLSANENFRNVEVELARCTADISYLKDRSTALTANYQNLKLHKEEISTKLVEKYGENFSINMETGEIIRQDEHNS